jgi:hypothetical protein
MEEESRDDAHDHRARQGHAATLRRRPALIARAAACALALAAGEASAQTVTGFAVARYGSGSGIQDENELPVADFPAQTLGPVAVATLPPDDPELPGTSAEAEAVFEMDLGAGFFSAATGSAGEVLGFGVNRFGAGSTRVSYREDLSVASSSVDAGTPVTIRLRYRIAFGLECFYDLAVEFLGPSASHDCITDLEVRTLLSDLDGESVASTETHFVNVGFEGSITGLFADPDATGEAAVTAEVGDTIRLELFAEAGSLSRLAPYEAAGTEFPDAATGTALVLVFGIESDTPEVQIVSPLLGGPLPDFAGVTPEHALSRALAVSIGAPVTVPEPHAIAAAVAVFTLLALRQAAAPSFARSQPRKRRAAATSARR